MQPNKYYLAVLAMFKDDATIIPEWMEHHLAHGVQHFFLIGIFKILIDYVSSSFILILFSR